ncbi:MAG: hypothetical protein WCY00_01630 [Candidatus Dojkabacteria bacterium]
MAKKKNKTVKKDSTKKLKKESMVKKVEIKEPKDQEKLSRVVGGMFIFLGILLISYGIFSFIKFNKTPELDETLDLPSLAGTEMLTSAEEITIRGTATDFDQVFVYVDNDEVARVKVADDFTFEYLYSVEQEGKYAVSVAGVKGFPKRYISSQSDMRIIEVDWTPPELVDLQYPVEVGTETFTVVGMVEPNCEATLRRGTDKYVGNCDEQGNFKIEGIVLEDDGPNIFTLEIADEAGNIIEIEEKVKVIYSMESDVDGNAVFDELPVASGELEAAMKVIKENNLMVLFGIIALAALMFSSMFVLVKYKGRE